MNPIEARRRAEESFKHTGRALDRQPAIPRYETEAVMVRAKTARLKAVRLAKERAESSADWWPRSKFATDRVK